MPLTPPSTGGLVHNNSPVNLISKFVHLMRSRFAQPGTPWVYSDNAADTAIFIDAEYSAGTDYSNQSPALVVSRGSTVQSRPVIADRGSNTSYEMMHGGKDNYGTAEADIRIACIGQTYGESATIGDITQATVMMTLKAITRAFTLLDISPVVLSPTTPFQRDELKFITYVDFRVTFEQHWFTIDVSPKLRKVFLDIETVLTASQNPAPVLTTTRPNPTLPPPPDPGFVASPPPAAFKHSLVFINSPLSLLGKFCDFLKARFQQPGTPWVYSDNEADTGVFIAPEYLRENSQSNLSPAIFVGRGSVTHTRTVLGDLHETSPGLMNRMREHSYGNGEADIRMECVGQTYGESAILADIVQAAISMSRVPITKAFTLLDISTVVLGPTSPYQRDEHKFVTYVDFRVTFERRWFVAPVAPVLRGAKIYVDVVPPESPGAPDLIIHSGPSQLVQGGGSTVLGLPPGGTTGQVLAKASNEDGDVEWVDQTGTTSGYSVADNAVYSVNYVHVGFTAVSGAWYIYRRNLTTDERLYATGSAGYSAAWTARDSLTYSTWTP